MRSYLHFSQLSAWLSSSRGEEPKNILFRITIPGETFASKFAQSTSAAAPEEHFFPPAAVGRSSSVHVSVRSIPRCESVPSVICPHKEREGAGAVDAEFADRQTPSTSPEEEEGGKVAMVGAVAWRDVNKYGPIFLGNARPPEWDCFTLQRL